MSDVFVGFVFDEQKELELLKYSKCGVSAAVNQYQKGFLAGIPEQVQIISALSTGAFPKLNRKLYFKKNQGTISSGEIIYLPYINFYYIRDFMFESGIYQHLREIIEKQDHTTIYVYSLYIPSLKAMTRLKKKYGDRIHYCLIIPDLPGKYGLVRKGIKGIRDRAEFKDKMTLSNYADSFVFLTEAMKDLFEPKPYTVIEGFLPDCSFDYSLKRVPKSVLYTGSLNRAYGFGTLLEAFSMISDPDAQLWICGAGDMEGAVKEAARKDPRIQFKGFLPKSEISALQTQCDVLVNPRTDEGEYTKYSFPSKTMEYLLSGSKVVMYRLAGIGDEYYQHIRVVEEHGPQAMASALQDAWTDEDFYLVRSRNQIKWIRESKEACTMVKACEIWKNKDTKN